MRALNIPAWALAAAVSVWPAAAYYHYVHYTSRAAPFAPIMEKFDLNALPNGTVTFFVSEEGPIQYSTGDGFASVLSQVQEAARAWNSVRTSSLRVAFGGLFSPGSPQITPAGEIVFEELPPGVLGLGGPTARAQVSEGPNGPFIPITRAVVRLNRDLTERPGPSYSEAFFLTLLHEMGHALGLQHALTSSAMSTDVTRATSRAKPLDDDDVAGLSLLYPARSFASRFGSISGRVMTGEEGVHLASVVAVRQGGSAVSTLTNPDGTYRIDGVPPGQYLVYAHPLPPATQSGFGPANVVLPRDSDDSPVPAGGAFDTVFYPGTRDPLSVTPIPVSAGATASDIDLSVKPRDYSPIYGVTTYSFYDQTPVKPGYLNVNPGAGTVVAYGAGLTSGADVAPGLGVTSLDGSAIFAPGSFRAYGNPTFLAFDLLFNFASGAGPRHLVFWNSSDIYVLPSAIHLVQAPPPSIASVVGSAGESGAGTVVLTGAGLTAKTRYYFDGAPAVARSFDAEAQQAVVTPPPAPAGHTATITAVNPDGQTSMFVQAQSPPSFTYGAGGQPSVSFAPFSLPAGSEGLVEITGADTNFVQGDTVIGFGSADVAVRRVFVISPTYALANVAVERAAEPMWTLASVVSGLQVSAVPFGFHVAPASASAPRLRSEVVNAATGVASVWPGVTAILSGANLAVLGAPLPALSLRDMAAGTDVPVNIVSAGADQIVFEIPADFRLGPTILKFSLGSQMSRSIAVLIEPPPPAIVAVRDAAGEGLGPGRAARTGEVLTILLSNMGDPSGEIAAGRIAVTIGGVAHSILLAGWSSDSPGLFTVQVLLSTDVVPESQTPVTVSLDGRACLPVNIPVQ